MTRECEHCFYPMSNMRAGKYCSNACRQAAWKQRVGYSVVGVRNPNMTSGTPQPIGGPQATLQVSQRQREQGRPRRSGRQVSYWKAVDVAKRILMEFGHTDESAQELAELWMREALPARQREQHQREERRPA